MRLYLCVILLASVSARIASALYQGSELNALPGIADQISYHKLATRVLEGHGFTFDVGWWPATPAGQPTAHWSYIYVLFLSAVYALGGPNIVAARIIQAVLVGLLQPLITWRIARRLFGSRVGMVSASFSAVYAYFVFYGGALMTESFYIVAILWAVDIATGIPTRKSSALGWRSWIQLGAACALATLLRQVFLFLAPVILLWLLWKLTCCNRVISIRQLAARTAVVPAILIACLAPWTYRNYKVFDAWVLLNTNSGFAFFWGNHPVHGTNFVPILPASEYGSLIPEALSGLNEAAMDRALLRKGIEFVREDPVRYMRLSASRIKEFFRFWPSDGSSRISNYARALSFGIFFPLAVGGQLLALYSCMKQNRIARPLTQGTSLLILLGAGCTLLHLMTWTLIRYRLPVDAIFIPFSAICAVVGYDFLINRFRVQNRTHPRHKEISPETF